MISLLVLLFAGLNLINGDVLHCDYPKDIVVVLDSSNSISQTDFDDAKMAIVNLIKAVSIENGADRVAFVQFSGSAEIKFNLDTFKDPQEMIVSVVSAKHKHGVTAIGKALKLVTEKIMPKMRPGKIQIVILATDGTNNVYPPPYSYAEILKNNSVNVISIGVGEDVDTTELKRLASENALVLLSNYTELIKRLEEILYTACPHPDPMPPPPPQVLCALPQQDLVFLIDFSSSITDEDAVKSKEFVKSFVRNVQLGTNKTRVALLSFSESVRLDFNLDRFTKMEDYITAIDGAEKFGTATGIGKALQMVLLNVWPKRRDSIPFNIILVTDGKNNIFPQPKVPATELKKQGANIYTVAIGNEVDREELRAVSSNNKTVEASNYSQLMKDIENIQKLITCPEQGPLP